MTSNDDELNARGRRLVRGGLAAVCVAALALTAFVALFAPGQALPAFARLAIVLLIALLTDRGRRWAMWAMGVAACLVALSAAAGVVNTPLGWLRALFVAVCALALAGYAMVVMPASAGAYLRSRR